MTDQNYDLIIIGGGAGAFAAAIKANELGAKTLMVNKGLPIGGTCVNVGCVPSKHLLSVGELVSKAKHHDFKSVDIPDVHLDFAKAIEEELELVEGLRKAKYENVLSQLEKVTFTEGEARFTSPHEIEVEGKKYTAEKFVIATGSIALPPPVEGLQETGFITHIEALRNKELPKRLVVIGAGALGMEFAQLFNNFGSKVDVLVRGEQILTRTESEVADALGNYLSRDGITTWKKTAIQKVSKDEGDKVVSVEVDGKSMELRADEILVATGKTPNTEKLNLTIAGVEIDDKKAIKVNDFYQTNAPHIYAAGDVTNKPLRLETTAGKEGSYAVENALKGTNKAVDYWQVPYAVFTYPAVAGVGMTDADVVSSGRKCVCRTVDFAEIPKAQILKDTRGLIKMVATEDGKIVGVHMVAPQAADIINQAVYIIKAGMTINDVLESLPVFPTLSESIKIAAQSYVSDITKLSCCV